VIDSLQVAARKPVATPANWTVFYKYDFPYFALVLNLSFNFLQPGSHVMVLPSVKDEDIPALFPKGVDTVKMPSGINYVRTTLDY